MKRILMLGLLGMVLVASLAAQTRRVGHRSHSGSPATFAMMLEEDHLGIKDPTPRVIYNVNPFVAKVRAHYEKVAKSIPQPVEAVNPSRSQMDSIPALRDEPNSVRGKSPVPNSPKVQKKGQIPEASAQAIPAPDFLVKSRPRTSPTVEATEGAPNRNNLWMLAGLLACTVAPGIFVASALLQRRLPH